jgi:hypothetical protein
MQMIEGCIHQSTSCLLCPACISGEHSALFQNTNDAWDEDSMVKHSAVCVAAMSWCGRAPHEMDASSAHHAAAEYTSQQKTNKKPTKNKSSVCNQQSKKMIMPCINGVSTEITTESHIQHTFPH